jgi:hypothetical protein
MYGTMNIKFKQTALTAAGQEDLDGHILQQVPA